MMKWCSVADLETLPRQRVLDANDLIDALDEVAELRRLKNAQK